MTAPESSLLISSKDSAPESDSQVKALNGLSGEAFEQAKKDAISITKNGGGISLNPDIYLNATRQSPWGAPGAPGQPRPPFTPPDNSGKQGEHKIPQPPGGPVLPNPGDVLKTDPNSETYASKISREAMMIGGGIGLSVFDGIANLPEHIPQIASSIVIGGTLAAMSKTGRLGTGAALVVGAYFTTRFVLDTLNDKERWCRFSNAVEDTWKSDANFRKNLITTKETLGDYTFDTGLSLASGYVGYKNPKLGEYILSILRVPPIGPRTPPPFNPRIATTTMYMAIMPPAGFYRNYGDRSPFGGPGWSFDIHGEIRRTPGIITRTPNFVGPHQDRYDREDYERWKKEHGDRDKGDRDREKDEREKGDHHEHKGNCCSQYSDRERERRRY